MTGQPRPAAEEEAEQPPAVLPPASPDRLLGQGQSQGPSGLREVAEAQGVLEALPPVRALGSPVFPLAHRCEPGCLSGHTEFHRHPNLGRKGRRMDPLQGGHPPDGASMGPSKQMTSHMI